MTSRRARGLLGLVTLLSLAGCHASRGTVLVVSVTLQGSLPDVTSLHVTLTSAAGTSENQYEGGRLPIAFPTTLTAQLPARVGGDLTIDIRALGPDGASLAHGRQGPFTLVVGTRQLVVVQLDCGADGCAPRGADGGADAGSDARVGGDDPRCGNGRIDVDETCDTAIAGGAPGACPRADCDDGIPCTKDVRVGLACQASCRHEEISERVAGDKCCPVGASAVNDPDCSATCGDGTVEAGETCDTALAPGLPGACPAGVSAAAACDDRDACTRDLLVSQGTCDAICAHVATTRQSGATRDGCCPAGAWQAVDADCPSGCGDGVLQEAAGERCDPGLPPTAAGGCPESCDDGQPCTLDLRVGTGCNARCEHTEILELVSGDGCCPANATRRTDRDCPPTCGNGVVEPGESCDSAAKGEGACPTSCPPSPSACLRSTLVGTAAACTTRCELRVAACAAQADGCCADHCTAATDPDCSPTCGDGVVQAASGETCDTALGAGAPGACARACSDGVACTRDVLVGAGTCQATCLFLPIKDFRAGDGCCPAGADAIVDPDCAPVCGNGVAEPPGETCDYAAALGACPARCPAGDACTPVRREGSVGTCTSACVAHPVTACVAGDGCCPAGCTLGSDADCPVVCGDGVRSGGEACDRGITAGLPGACAASCDDGDDCTNDWATGTPAGCSRACSHARITACLAGDGCCPAGCETDTDGDCAPTCGDGRLGAGETCDPPATCPTACPDDGDPCTRERLVGDDARCDVACQHVPVTSCSGGAADLCCPTACAPASDVDCPAPSTRSAM